MNTKQFYEWIGRPRSVLTLLSPIYYEAHGIESLTSYLVRNQLTLGVGINELIDHASLFLAAEEVRAFKKGFYFARSFPINLNGNNQESRLLAKSLQVLKPEYDFEALTIKSYEHNSNGLWMMPKLKKSIAWCGHCLSEWQANNDPIYFPLLWQLQGNHSCRIHKTPLSQYCTDCGTSHKIFTHHLMKGVCSRCKSELSANKSKIVCGQTEMF